MCALGKEGKQERKRVRQGVCVREREKGLSITGGMGVCDQFDLKARKERVKGKGSGSQMDRRLQGWGRWREKGGKGGRGNGGNGGKGGGRGKGRWKMRKGEGLEVEGRTARKCHRACGCFFPV